MKPGEEVFKAVRTTCHTAGAAGAPKVGDNAGWAPRIAQGAPTLYDHAIKGYQGKAGVMPAKGGNSDLDDFEVQRAAKEKPVPAAYGGATLLPASETTKKEPEFEPTEKQRDDLNVDAVFAKLKTIAGKTQDHEE